VLRDRWDVGIRPKKCPRQHVSPNRSAQVLSPRHPGGKRLYCILRGLKACFSNPLRVRPLTQKSHVSPTPDLIEAEVIAFRDAAAFDAWLDEHVGLPGGVWLKMANKGSGIPSLTSDEAVDVGLCHGWISGQRKPLDSVYYLQKYVPRRPRSRWSQVNVAKVAALTVAGRMRPPGLAEVEAAQADGRWAAAYESQRHATVPTDLAAALAASQRAGQAFNALGKTQQYAVILRLLTARTTHARAAQLRKAMSTLEARGAS
jgi:uncharacterized protein YdeI (YjbR/CyaY-like superfamily)